MAEGNRRSTSTGKTVTDKTEYQKLRETYPDLPPEMLAQLAEQAIQLRNQQQKKEAAGGLIGMAQTFENELREKLPKTVAELTIKHGFDIYNKSICVETPKVELPYKSVNELASYFKVSLNERAAAAEAMKVASKIPASAVAPAREVTAPVNKAAPVKGGTGARILRNIIIWVGVFLIFFGGFSAFNTGHLAYLWWTAGGVALLFLARLIR